MSTPDQIEPGVYRIPLDLPESLEDQRSMLEDTLIAAQQRIKLFAQRHGWEPFTRACFIQRAEIYATKDAFDQTLIQLFQLNPATALPKTYSGVLEHEVLMTVAPDIYAENYPEGLEERSFEKLIIHELAHQLHIRILGGNEAAMGPIWFFEGFAIYAAEQFVHSAPDLNSLRMLDILASVDRGNYREYGSLLRYLVARISLNELVERAADPAFQARLQSMIEPAD